MHGYRKLIALVFISVLAVVCDLNQYQADVLMVIGATYLGSNAGVAIARTINEKLAGKNRSRVGGDSVDSG